MKIRLIAATALAVMLSSLAVRACDVKPIKTDDVVFFGDSTTAHLAVRGGVPADRVWSGKTSTVLFSSVCDVASVYDREHDVSMTLADAVREKKPAVLVITLGVSGGAGFMPEKNFKRVYSEMIDTVRTNSPDTILFAQSVLPLSADSAKHYEKLTKEAVLEANVWIRQVCEEKDVPYIDTHPLLCGRDGYLKKEYQNDEYMHLTSAAYSVVLKNVYGRVNEHIKKTV